jgi:hypothetical protein
MLGWLKADCCVVCVKSSTHLDVLIDPGYLIEDPEYIAKSL